MGSTTVTKNKQGYGYKYTDLSQIHEYLESIGMKYYQYIEAYEGNDYIYTVPIKVMEDGSEKEYSPRRGCRIIQATLSGKSNPAQENGSAITYARRYSLLMAFGLATEDDDAESLTRKPQTKQQTKPQPIPQVDEEVANQQMIDRVDRNLIPEANAKVTQTQLDTIKSEMQRTGINMHTILTFAKAKSLEEINQATAVAIINNFAKTPNAGERK